MDCQYPTPQQTDSRVVFSTMPDLNAIVKAYDIRGIVPDQLDADVAYAIGVAFAKFANAPHIVIAHDMRPSGP
jgi:phosphomannomutase